MMPGLLRLSMIRHPGGRGRRGGGVRPLSFSFRSWRVGSSRGFSASDTGLRARTHGRGCQQADSPRYSTKTTRALPRGGNHVEYGPGMLQPPEGWYA